ncbi:MAG: hypothetical protein IJQ31_10715 [Thermoguttaceae bacterium]|nr:hypothetical protein [Thermoguttaceae bacterium]
MKSAPFSKRPKRFWNSRPIVQIYRVLRRYVSLRWWVKRSWKTKVQLLIGLTALLLLVLSLAAWYVFQKEQSKIANNFLRLQLFGPQEIFLQPPGSPKDTPKSNFCPYYLEVRRPYGGALANVRVEASFQTPDDAPFWFLSDVTNREGRFQLDVPDMQMPERVKLKIHAEDGKKSADFTAFLKAQTLHESEPQPETVSEDSFLLEDRPLDSIVPQLESAPEKPLSLVIPHRVFENPELSFSVLTSEEEFHPVFVGVWQNGKLLICRPLLARKEWRYAALSLPENAFGMFSVLLIDSAVSPPRVLQHELIYRLPPQDPEREAAQRAFLRSYANSLNTPEFRAEKQSLEFLPGELAEPVEGTDSENSALLAAADRLLGGTIVTKPTLGPGLALPELEPMSRLMAQLDQLSAIQPFVPPPEMSYNPESIRSLMDRALKLQGLFLRRNLASQTVQAQYAPSLPVVFDSLSVQEESYRMAVQKFRLNVKKRLGSLVCLILCSALCLVVMMLMMTILGLPTDWRNWMLTFCVVLLAMGLATVISSQSDVDSAGESVHYAIFEGVPGP